MLSVLQAVLLVRRADPRRAQILRVVCGWRGGVPLEYRPVLRVCAGADA